MTDDEMIAFAARGNAEAQSTLVDVVTALAINGVCSRFEAACLAEVPARMAAAHGGAMERLKLAGVLLVRAETLNDAQPGRAHAFKMDAAEVLSALAAEGNRDATVALATLLGGMADEGDEFAGQALGVLSDSIPADLMREAVGFDLLIRGELAGSA